jgi:SNF2 family DNA or RNA helicase
VAKGTVDLRVRVGGDATWLELEGELRVDDGAVLDMHALLDAMARAEGRFVPIGEDAFLALTDDLRTKLEALARVAALGENGRVAAALLPAIEVLCEGANVSFAEPLAGVRERLARAHDLSVRVRSPRGLRAELRDYQRAGFSFLARRTDAGIGACLADDMGLGKTVQAIAVLLRRRKLGPALVVAPTSVCRNWEDELRRFAPSLVVRRVAEGERESVVVAAGRGEVVLASYALLAAEEELFARRPWGTVVLDEAHALKNAGTRRWAAAKRLTGGVKIALTGTPVENHAGELHALFDLIAPGMLGSRRAFERVLAGPIAAGDVAASQVLRDLVRPVVLRRTKGEVLRELPPKTEVVQVLSPSREHQAFYEAARQRAVETVERTERRGAVARAPRSPRIALLAEITRLRRAAIDPRLVAGDEAPRGVKIDALTELCAELRSEGRRTLIFSQFLEVLDLARASLEERGVVCLRLDGSMPAPSRAEAVRAFQGGAADALLVSLKAGGVGLNLTAADVVVLLDPWWNPAVEDQAAARAHRLGQSRPVTVVRLVTEGTIEEKVLALHAKKRALYDAVVAGADGRADGRGDPQRTLDVDALYALLGRA